MLEFVRKHSTTYHTLHPYTWHILDTLHMAYYTVHCIHHTLHTATHLPYIAHCNAITIHCTQKHNTTKHHAVHCTLHSTITFRIAHAFQPRCTPQLVADPNRTKSQHTTATHAAHWTPPTPNHTTPNHTTPNHTTDHIVPHCTATTCTPHCISILSTTNHDHRPHK